MPFSWFIVRKDDRTLQKACECKKQRFSSAINIENLLGIKLLFLIFLLKTLIVSTD